MDAYLSRLPRIVRHVSLLLHDRGFESLPWTEDCDFVELALERRVSVGELLTSRVRHRHNASTLLVVFLDPIFDMGKGREVMTSSFQLHGALASARPAEHTLIISFAKLSPDASRESAKLRRVATVMPVSSLAFPISQHVMIPKHTPLDADAAHAWELEHKVERSKLPILRFSDPVRVWYGWPKGTIVQVERGACVAWRIVK
jgi:DNA-directed RNA polymerase subunit H (RpoH/RPB5)